MEGGGGGGSNSGGGERAGRELRTSGNLVRHTDHSTTHPTLVLLTFHSRSYF